MNPDTTVAGTADVQAVITDAIADFGVDAAQIAPDAALADLEVDSLDMAELSQIIHDAFGVEIVAEDAPLLTTVGDLIALVGARR